MPGNKLPLHLFFRTICGSIGKSVNAPAVRRPTVGIGIGSSVSVAIVTRGNGEKIARVASVSEGETRKAVAVGGLTQTAPLRLVEHTPQATPHEPFRLQRIGGDYAVQAEVRGEWRTLYRFDLQEQVLPDYELTSWYLSNHPQSHFVKRLIAARTDTERRYALLDNELAVHRLGEETVRMKLTSAAELQRVLSETFRIVMPQAPEVARKLAEIAASG